MVFDEAIIEETTENTTNKDKKKKKRKNCNKFHVCQDCGKEGIRSDKLKDHAKTCKKVPYEKPTKKKKCPHCTYTSNQGNLGRHMNSRTCRKKM